MTKDEKQIVRNEIAQTYELYGFEMSFTEFQDIFELGAEFGYQLALMKAAEIPATKEDVMIFKKKEDKILAETH
ncbi:MAG: hypothetical protein JWR18_4172 [Segetibacter sp.]|nr:hypothetical protein [Segetibacter sp.]